MHACVVAAPTWLASHLTGQGLLDIRFCRCCAGCCTCGIPTAGHAGACRLRANPTQPNHARCVPLRPLPCRSSRRMSRDQRVRDNWALIYAAQAAAKRGVPVAVAFSLVSPRDALEINGMGRRRQRAGVWHAPRAPARKGHGTSLFSIATTARLGWMGVSASLLGSRSSFLRSNPQPRLPPTCLTRALRTLCQPKICAGDRVPGCWRAAVWVHGARPAAHPAQAGGPQHPLLPAQGWAAAVSPPPLRSVPTLTP